MDYIVKMDGMKVRAFYGWEHDDVVEWAENHCHGQFEVVGLKECDRLPSASGRIYPNEDLVRLVYKPFVSLA